MRAQLSDFSRQVQLTYVEEETLPRALEVIKAVPPRSIVLHIWQRGIRAEGHARSAGSRATRGRGRAGACLRDRRSQHRHGHRRRRRPRHARDRRSSRQMSRCRFSRGTRAQDIPVEDAPLVPIFDWRQIKRWGIDPIAAAAPDSNIRFFTPTMWEAYRPYIIATIAIVVAAQLLAIAGLLVQRARRRRAEETVAGTRGHDSSQLRADPAARGTTDQRAGSRARGHRPRSPRRRLPGTGGRVDRRRQPQEVVRLAFRTRTPSRRCRRSTSETLGMFEGIRRLSHDLHPATLRLVGLATALRAHCVEVEKRHAVRGAIHGGRRLRRPPPRCRRVFLPHRSGVASQRRRARRSATALGLARAIRRCTSS